jgi:hypothetical protein
MTKRAKRTIGEKSADDFEFDGEKKSDRLSIEDLEEGLRIDEHALDEALKQQPDLFYRVTKKLNLLVSRRDAMKQELSTVEAEVDIKIREKHRQADTKPTDKSVEAEKRTNREVMGIVDELINLNAQVAQWQALKEAFQQRSYVLKDLVNLYVASYFGDLTDSSQRNKISAERDREVVRRYHRSGNLRDRDRDG